MEHPVASPYHHASPHTDYFPANTSLINEDLGKQVRPLWECFAGGVVMMFGWKCFKTAGTGHKLSLLVFDGCSPAEFSYCSPPGFEDLKGDCVIWRFLKF